MYAYFPTSPPPELIVKHLPEYHFIGPSELGPTTQWQRLGRFPVWMMQWALFPTLCSAIVLSHSSFSMVHFLVLMSFTTRTHWSILCWMLITSVLPVYPSLLHAFPVDTRGFVPTRLLTLCPLLRASAGLCPCLSFLLYDLESLSRQCPRWCSWAYLVCLSSLGHHENHCFMCPPPQLFFLASSERVNLITPSWSGAEVINAALTLVALPFRCPALSHNNVANTRVSGTVAHTV